MVLPVVIQVKNGPGSTIKSATLVLMDGSGLTWRVPTGCDEDVSLYEPPAMRRCRHRSDKTRLMKKFVNVLETIAAHRDESLTGNTSSEKTKKYFIEIEPNAENTQVKVKEQKNEGLKVTLAWLVLSPVKNPIEMTTILALYLKNFADRENELRWANKSLKHHNAMLVARTQKEGKESDWKGMGMDQISRQFTSLLNEKKAMVRSLGAALHEYQETHKFKGSSNVYCDLEAPRKDPKYCREQNNEGGSEEPQGGDSRSNSTSNIFVKKVEWPQWSVDKDIQMDQGREPKRIENISEPAHHIKVTNNSRSKEVTTTTRSTDCAVNASGYSKQQVNKRPKLENYEDNNDGSYFSYGSDSDSNSCDL